MSSTQSNQPAIEYIAGSCNIGPAEIKRRLQTAVVGGIAYLISAIALIARDASTPTRFVAFLPAMAATVGYVQARRKFCFAYGLAGFFSLEKAGATTKVKDPVALKADRAYAIKILAMSFMPALILTAIVVLL
jgi:hypothetical protein